VIKTPVWFVQDGEQLYVLTVNNSGKIKRIRNNGRVNVEPSDRAGKPLGATVGARARVLSASENTRANDLLNKKYGWQKRAFDVAMKLRKIDRVYVEVTPDR
jgi:PPOX class probable F420-dependent enzyme